ncbi:MAG: nitroreductase family protein [Prevotellaceae bacterium]|nr:nitroreductase family protein [Prevotellaceae bacterium]
MNKTSWLNLLLAVALVILSIKITFLDKDGKTETTAETEAVNASGSVIDNIMTRTSIRAYQDLDVSEETVDTLLRAAMAAPSAGNKQPWHFVVIRDKATLNTISENLNTMKMAKDAPLAIVVCGDLNKTFPDEGVGYWVQDASAATENLLLAAHSMGLGAVWCGIYPLSERVAFLKNLLKLPENIVPLNVIPIGYPDEKPDPKDKWNEENVHFETWN